MWRQIQGDSPWFPLQGEEPRNTIDPERECGGSWTACSPVIIPIRPFIRVVSSRRVLSRMLEIRVTPPPPHPPPPHPAHDASSVSDQSRVGVVVGGWWVGPVERSWTAWAMDLCGIQIPRPLICMLVRTGTPSSTVRLLLRQPVHQMILVPEPKRNLCERSSSASKEVDGLSHRVAMFGVGWRQLPEAGRLNPARGF